MSVLTRVILGFVLAAVLTVGALLGGLVVLLQTREQSRVNQAHFDCAVSVFARTEPPQCAAIIEGFRRVGIFPAAGAP